jgi:large subunit ribosomal protein L18
MQTTTMHKLRRRIRVRSRIHGTALRPRLTVHITAKHITAQLIDDDAGKTLGYATTVKATAAKGTMTERAIWVGKEIAASGKKNKISKVVFDRAGRLYHGRLAALAEAARSEGLEF